MGQCATEIGVSLRILRSPRRRHALACVGERDAPIERDSLAERIADREVASGDQVGDSTVANVATELHHVHLPMLAEANLVEYDPQSGRVGATDSTLRYRTHLQYLADAAVTDAAPLEDG